MARTPSSLVSFFFLNYIFIYSFSCAHVHLLGHGTMAEVGGKPVGSSFLPLSTDKGVELNSGRQAWQQHSTH